MRYQAGYIEVLYTRIYEIEQLNRYIMYKYIIITGGMNA